MSEHNRSSKSDSNYTMRKRAKQMEETKQRIAEAAMRLHTTVGPANTTISAVAEEADVTRVTVYRHFPDEDTLFLACSAHWAQLHPAPDPAEWADIDDWHERVRTAVSAMHRFYRDNHDDLYPIMRDFEAMPEAFRMGMRQQQTELVETLVVGSGIRGQRRDALRATLGLVTSFGAWRSLALEGGLDHDATVELGVTFIESV